MYQWVAIKLMTLEEARLSAEGAEQLLVKSQSSFKLFAICKLLLWKYVQIVQQCIAMYYFLWNVLVLVVLIHGAPFLKYCWMLTSKQPLKFFNDFGNTLTWNAIITCWNPTSIYYMLLGLCNSGSCSQRVQNSCPILPQLLKLFCFVFFRSVSQWFLGIQHPTQRTNWHL